MRVSDNIVAGGWQGQPTHEADGGVYLRKRIGREVLISIQGAVDFLHTCSSCLPPFPIHGAAVGTFNRYGGQPLAHQVPENLG